MRTRGTIKKNKANRVITQTYEVLILVVGDTHSGGGGNSLLLREKNWHEDGFVCSISDRIFFIFWLLDNI